MKVIVNGKEHAIFEGATVEHAVRLFAPSLLSAVEKGVLCVTDRFGNAVSLSGSLSDGSILTIREAHKTGASDNK